MKQSLLVIQIALLIAFVILGCANDGSRDNPFDPASPTFDPAVAFDSVSTEDISTLYDERDGKIYRVVKFGNQYWMADNLKFETDSSFCYNDDPLNCEKYGRLYKWSTAVGMNESYNYQSAYIDEYYGRGLCPDGWILPGIYDWESLVKYAGGAQHLKSKFGWFRDYNGYDSYGFTALPGGFRESNGIYKEESNMAAFWTRSEESPTIAQKYYLMVGYSGGYDGLDSKSSALSVRCIKD